MKNLYALMAMVLLWTAINIPAKAQDYETRFQTRRQQLINQVADVFAPTAPDCCGATNLPDPEKHNWPATIARLAKYGDLDTMGNNRIARFRTRAPFHFSFVGMARIMNLYPNAPNMVLYKQQYLLNVKNRSDSYNAWTGEGTENHLSMSRTSGYLYAQNMLADPVNFPLAATWLADMKLWVKYYSKRLYETGNAEWNSSTYGVYNLEGWLNLYDFAQDPEVKQCARAVLDYYVAELALHYSQGTTGGSESRGAVTVSCDADTDYLSWLWFDDAPKTVIVGSGSSFFKNNRYTQAVHAATSSYRPNALAVKLAQKKFTAPSYYSNSKPGYLLDSPGLIKQNFYIGKAFTLGASYLPHGGWTGGDVQYTTWKLTARVDTPGTPTTNAYVVTGNGRYYNRWNGQGRNPWDQVVQHKKTVIHMNKLPADTVALMTSVRNLISGWKTSWLTNFDQRFPLDTDKGNPVGKTTNINFGVNAAYISFPNTATSAVNSNIVFLDLDNSYIAIRSLALTTPTAAAAEGSSTTRKQIQDNATAGTICGLVMEAADAIDYASFAAFQTAVIAKNGLDKSQLGTQSRVKYVTLDNDTINAVYQQSGTYTEPLYDWGYGPTAPLVIHQTPPFIQPTWTTGVGSGRLATWTVNSINPITSQTWNVYQGPNMELVGSNLKFMEATDFYKVDYTGTLPVFTTNLPLSNERANIALQQNSLTIYPNPAQGETTIQLNLASSETVTVEMHNAAGQLVGTPLQNRFLSNGTHSLTVNTGALPAGLYIIKCRAGKEIYTSKLVVVR